MTRAGYRTRRLGPEDAEIVIEIPDPDHVQEEIDFIRWVVGDAWPANEARGPETPPLDSLGEELERTRRANRQLVNGAEEAKQPIPEEIAELMEEGETLPQARRRLTELLFVEQAELKNLRGMAGEDLPREAQIEKLLGLFARLGEI